MKTMKYYSKIFAVALLGFATACTQKEIDQVTPQNDPEITPETGAVTFTATIPGTKGYDATGKMTWEVGDIILLWTNNITWTSSLALTTSNYNTGAYTGNFDVVIVNDAMFTDGTHKTISFSIDSGILPAQSPAPTRYYAVTTHDLGVLYHCANSSVSTVAAKLSTIYAGTRPHFAVASCSSAETNLTFKNAATVFQWDTDWTDITKIEMVVPDSGGTDMRFGARFQASYNSGDGTWSFTNSPNTSADPTTLTSWTKPSGGVRQAGPYYIMLAPGMTFSNGFKFKVYTSELVSTMVPTASSFSTAAGAFWDFGKLEDHSYHVKYLKGDDIMVGDLEVNKTNYPSSRLISSISDTYNGTGTVYAQWGVIFLGPGIDGVKLSGSGDKCIVIGNDLSQRSSIQVNEQISISAGANVAFKNLAMSWASGNTATWFPSNSTINNFAFDNCRIDFYTRLCELGTGSVNSVSITNSDIIVLDSATDTYPVHCGLLTRAETEHAATNLVFKNNLVTTETSASKKFALISKWDNNPGVTFNTVDISYNTFHNVGSADHFLIINNIGSSITMTKNLLWRGDGFNWIRLTGLDTPASASFTYSGVTDNKLTGYVLRSVSAADDADVIVATGTAGYYEKKDENYPFNAGDLATVISTRDYTPIAALSGYGVSNPKRLQ